MRLLPQGLAARFALLLVAALVAANAVALVLAGRERDRLDVAAREGREVARIVALVPALDGAPEREARRIAREASTRLAEVRIDRRPAVDDPGTDLRARALTARLAEALPGREVRVRIGPQRWRRGEGMPDVVLSVALDGGRWLNVVTVTPPMPDGARVFLMVVLLSLVATLAAGLWFIRQMTRPLATLADAARTAARGDHSVRVPVAGPREVRAAAAAFNEMQAQIEGFEADRMRTLGAVGHDLRTPITSLRLRAEMVEDDDLRQAMVRTLDEMAVMAQGLVSWAKGAGEAEPTAPLDLHALLRQVAADRGVPFAGRPAMVRGRKVALSRAVGNLIDNALRYAGGAQVALDVAGASARITVTDGGPGIPADRLATIFDPFVRGEDSRSRDTGGAGLGLSIARTEVLAHGGTIRLENLQPQGLRAVVDLPLA